MARIEGVDPKKTPFLMRQVFKKVRKMLGRDLTPKKIQTRVPRVFWVNVITEMLLGQRAKVPQPDELYAELRRHFSEEELIELAASAAEENYRVTTECSTWGATGCIARVCGSSSGDSQSGC